MKTYELAINSLPQEGDLKFVKEELNSFLNPKTQHEKEQAPIHILKIAWLCICEWSKSKEFGPKVFDELDKVKYTELDLFQKAVFHILASCRYCDGFFDVKNAEINWDFDMDNWKKTFENH